MSKVTRGQIVEAVEEWLRGRESSGVLADAILALLGTPQTVGSVEELEALDPNTPMLTAVNTCALAGTLLAKFRGMGHVTSAMFPATVLTPATTRDVGAEGMDQRGAFDDTVELARERNMSRLGEVYGPDSPLSFDHLLDMQKRIHEGNHSPAKLGRWLGWAQAALVAANVGVTLDDVKRINMLRAASAKGDGK